MHAIPNKFTNKTMNSYLSDLDKERMAVHINELSDSRQNSKFEKEEKLFCLEQFSGEEEIYGGQQ